MVCDTLIFFVNGKKITEEFPDPKSTLLSFLRDNLYLKGTKEACGLGACGSCTVMLSEYDTQNKCIRHRAVTACLVPLCNVHGRAVTTVEGIGSTRSKVHAVQESLALGNGTQCGFCSPGMVMSMYTLLRNNSSPSKQDIQRVLEGNLCRCTGYRPILQSFFSFSKEFTCPMGDSCCQKITNTQEDKPKQTLLNHSEFDSTQEPIFPSELQLNETFRTAKRFTKQDVTWFMPVSLQETLEYLKEYENAQINSGNTALQEKFIGPKCVISLVNVRELQFVRKTEKGLEIGAATKIADLENALQDLLDTSNNEEKKTLVCILSLIREYGSEQIRNMATLGGSLMANVTWSDFRTLLSVMKTEITIVDQGGEHITSLACLIAKGLKTGSLIKLIFVPFEMQHSFIWMNKICTRNAFDTSNLSMAVRIYLNDDQIGDISIALGGLSKSPTMLQKASSLLIQKKLNQDLGDVLVKEIDMDTEQIALNKYQKLLIKALFVYFIDDMTDQIQNKKTNLVKPYNFTQDYQSAPDDQPSTDMLGRPLPHLSSLEHTTGEAMYVDDIPKIQGEYFLALVTSTKSHAKLLDIDASAALKLPGVVGFLTHKDIPAVDKFGPDEIFASEKVSCVGQTIGAVVATDRRTATIASYMVKIKYEELQPTLTTIKEAIEHKNVRATRVLEKGDVDLTFQTAKHCLEGEISTGGQEHFYMETQTILVTPKNEKDEMEVYCASQSPQQVQDAISRCLGVPCHKICVKTKRLGGGFGGKVERTSLIVYPTAIAAKLFGRPIRCVLYRKQDMAITGGRHPSLAKYKVAFDGDGKFEALDVSLYVNGGYNPIFGEMCVQKSSWYIGGCYEFPNLRAKPFVCTTNVPINTAVRGFAVPQGLFIAETVVDNVACYLQVPVDQIRKKNLQKVGDSMIHGEILKEDHIFRCWSECMDNSDFVARYKNIQTYNENNMRKKRGIAIVPVRMGAAFYENSMNQATAIIEVFVTDGSIMLHVGGIEMGQGLHTKLIQIASRILNLPHETICISETQTNTVPNAGITAGSAGTEYNGLAVIDACKKLVDRIKPYKEKNPEGCWLDWVKAAHQDQTSLVVTGHDGIRDKTFIPNAKCSPENYHTYGVGCSEVELDCLTGKHKILRTDIVMDVGKSLNPTIDIGQIEGAFIMGYGMYLLEEIIFDKAGRMTTCGPEKYKIPTVGDIPFEFNVHLLKNSGNPGNPKAVYSSKAIGEAPFMLSLSVFHAVKHSVTAARADRGLTGYFRLDCPATPEQVLLAIHREK